MLLRDYINKFLFLGIIIGIYVAAWIIQNQLFLNWDISQLLHATRLMLAGGTYSNDFFIPNPPMILFLYTPPLLISKLLGIKVMIPFRIYIFLLISVSFSICCVLAQKIFSKQDNFILSTFLITLATIFLIVPLYEIGQRDCLLLVLTMPYLLLTTLQLEKGNVNNKLRIMIGLLASVGIAMKPHFIIIPFLVECYFAYGKKNLLACFRIETLVISLVIIIHIVITIIYFSDFIFIITPYILKNYYNNLTKPFSQLFLYPFALFFWTPFVFYIVRYPQNRYKNLSSILILALIGFIISFFVQHTTFLYHLIPSFSLSILLSSLLFALLVKQQYISKREYTLLAMVGLFYLGYILKEQSGIWSMLILAPKVFFGFFAILFAYLLYSMQVKKRYPLFSVFFKVAVIIGLGALVSFLAGHISWYSHAFLFTLIVLFVMYSLLMPKENKHMQRSLFIAVLGTLLFSSPVCSMKNIYDIGVAYRKEVLEPLIKYVSTQPANQSLYVISNMANYNAPLMDYIEVRSVERFDCLWMAADLAKRLKTVTPDILHNYIRNNTDKRFFLNMVADDIYKNKPDLIFVDIRNQNMALDGHAVYFDFLKYFVDNREFSNEWKNYHYLTTIAGGSAYSYNYKLQVYKRIMR